MASPAEDTVVFSTNDDASIALLRRLRAGAAVHFIHHVDVCSAPPEDLVADLQSVPGTDLAEDGYNSAARHRRHSETAPKPVKGLEGATFCNLSFGRKEGSGRSFDRMGWCMTEYDDKNDHVLCKVHRSSSSLTKGKLKPTTTTQGGSSSSSKSKKRKATCEHPQAPPSKMSLCASVDHRQVQQQQPLLSGCQMMMPDYDSLFPAEKEQLQQNTMFPAAEEQQLHQNAMFPVAEEQQQFQDNTPMDELLRACSPGSTEDLSSGPVYGSSCFPGDNFTMDDLFSSGSTGCCNTPKQWRHQTPPFLKASPSDVHD
ncbi:hypothetical protein HU200_030038 [Digitaria exilis]|uniref:NAC domain-containing protein n=1 Tax=Digitaria exilis TaxID=1010633 RepID=A0A835ENP7_9POAL|nr:hypothetical protein HU200_030038 [Digitaria exilis]